MQETGRFIDIPIVKIDDEFRSLIPVMVKEEKDALETSLLTEGCRDALVIWDGLLLDGHTRFELCGKHDIIFKIIEKTFETREQAKLWIINNQLGRRNLTPKQTSYLRGIRLKIQKGETVGAADKLAKEYGVSPRTIERDEKFAEKVNQLPPEEKEQVLSGKKKTSKGKISGGSTPKEPEPLEQLKRWWYRASTEDRRLFDEWVLIQRQAGA